MVDKESKRYLVYKDFDKNGEIVDTEDFTPSGWEVRLNVQEVTDRLNEYENKLYYLDNHVDTLEVLLDIESRKSVVTDVEEFDDLFLYSEEYPKNLVETGVLDNSVNWYVSSAYLNGIINYTRPVKSFLCKRYSEDHEWEKALVKVQENENVFHSNLGVYEDDVLILSESDHSYWFFWFDCDTSDCAIGRFSKEGLSKDRVISLFEKYVDTHDYLEDKVEIGLNGWVSF